MIKTTKLVFLLPDVEEFQGLWQTSPCFIASLFSNSKTIPANKESGCRVEGGKMFKGGQGKVE